MRVLCVLRVCVCQSGFREVERGRDERREPEPANVASTLHSSRHPPGCLGPRLVVISLTFGL